MLNNLLYTLTFVLSIVLASFCGFSQDYKFRNFSLEKGLTDPFIYAVEQGPQGYLMVGTGEGLGVYDGQNLTTYLAKDGLAEDFVSCLHYQDNNLWIGHLNGGISVYANGQFKIIETGEEQGSRIVSIVSQGNTVWVLSQNDGLKVYRDQKLVETIVLGEDIVARNLALFDNNKRLAILSSEGYWVKELEGRLKKLVQNWAEYDFVGVVNSGNDLIFATSDKLFSLNSNSEFIELRTEFSEEIAISGISMDNAGFLWVASDLGAYKCELKKQQLVILNSYTQDNGLTEDPVVSVYEDYEGNIWMATYGGGLFMLVDGSFTFYNVSTTEDQNIYAFAVGSNYGLMAVDGGLEYYEGKFTAYKKLYGIDEGLPQDRIESVLITESNHWLIGYANSGVFLSKDQQTFSKLDFSDQTLANFVHDISEIDNGIAIATEDGIYMLDDTYSMDRRYSTSEGLRHNKVYDIDFDHQGRLWIATRSNYVSYIEDDELKEIELPYKGVLLEMLSILRDDSSTWIGTANNGIIYVGETGFKHLTTEQGLLSNNCRALGFDQNGNVWVGHGNGLSRITKTNFDIKVFDAKDGITGEIGSNLIMSDGMSDLWLGSSNGLIHYDPLYERDVPGAPYLNITEILLNDKSTTNESLLDLKYGKYKLEFLFNAISFRNLDHVKYRYKLEGFDDEWHDLYSESPSVRYNKLTDGTYVFKVQACIGDECVEKTSGKIVIDSPYWVKWWFIALVLLLVGLLVFLIVKIRTRNLRKIRTFLEKNLEIKTREVVQKNELLEEKNKDITDSITYAEQIQLAMLPEKEVLAPYFSESFIFYRPKDIVSGDFYWAHDFGDYLIMICADCTGHGVPGSLVSIVGGMSFNKVLSVIPSVSPAQLLSLVDDEFNQIFKVKDDGFGSVRDGMDLAVCKIYKDTHRVEVSSAKRAYCSVIDGEIVLHRGNRYSIGGGDHGGKTFEQEEFNMKKGDRLYFFSDGYTDQIGGEKARKIMTSRMKSLIEESYDLNMDMQHDFFADFFDNWQGDEIQLDDVLLMGVKI